MRLILSLVLAASGAFAAMTHVHQNFTSPTGGPVYGTINVKCPRFELPDHTIVTAQNLQLPINAAVPPATGGVSDFLIQPTDTAGVFCTADYIVSNMPPRETQKWIIPTTVLTVTIVSFETPMGGGGGGGGGTIQATTLPLRGDGAGGAVSATFANIVTLWGGGSCNGFLKSDGTCTTATGTNVAINGANVVNPDFNTSTPAPGAGYQNVIWGVSGASVSAKVAVATAASLGLVIGTNVQAYNANLDTWATLAGGNATTAAALASTPTGCSSGSFPLGVDASGNAVSCTTWTSQSLLASQLPALVGDVSSPAGSPSVSVLAVNGVAYPAVPSANTVPLVTATSTITYTSMPNCLDSGGQHLNYNTSTHAWSCGSTGSAVGAVAFQNVSTGTNTVALTVGTGGSLGVSGTGTISATNTTAINGVVMASLGTGILKNTIVSGIPSIAAAGDFPTLNQNTTGTASNVTGTVLESKGGTGSNITTGAAGHVLRSNGTHYVDSAILPGDVPTLNQNTTGTALNVTGIVAEANGGTGSAVTAGAAGHVLRSNGTHYVDAAIQVADVPTLNQSTTGTASSAAAVNGVAYTAAPATNTVPVITASNVATYTDVPNCADAGGNHLNYNSTTHQFSCGATGGTAGSVLFSGIGPGTNVSAAMIVGNGASIVTSGTGAISATDTTGINGVLLSGLTGIYKFTAGVPSVAVAADFPTLNQSTTGSAASVAFSGVTAQTNTAALVMGTGGSLGVSGTGTISATNTTGINGVLLSGLGIGIYKFTAGVPSVAVAADFPTLNQSTTGSAASVLFSGVGAQTNTAALVIGTGGTLGVSGTGTISATNTTNVNGVAYATSPATNTLPLITAAATSTYTTVPDCTDAGGNHLNFNQSTHLFTCGTTGGTVSSVSFSGITGGPNNAAAMVVGSGASIAATGTGTISATSLNGILLSGLTTGIVKLTAGVPSIALIADFPTLNQNTTGTASNVTGIVAEARGGTGSNITTGIAGHYLRSDGTHYVDSGILAADVPTLNQSTTGSAATVSGIIAEANGGTGVANTVGAAGHVLRSNGTHYVDAQLAAIDVSSAVSYTSGTTYSAGAVQAFQNSATIEGLRLQPSVRPTTPGIGALIINSNASNTLEWWTGSGWASASGVPGCSNAQTLFNDGANWQCTALGPGLILTGNVLAVDSASVPGLSGTNTYSASSVNDFSAATTLRVPVQAAATLATAGDLKYDSTQKALFGYSTSTATRAAFTRTPQGGVQFSTTDILCANAADVPPTGTCTGHVATTETLYATRFTLPVSFYVTGKVLLVTAGFQVTTNGGTAINMNIWLRLGTTKLYGTAATAQATSLTNSGYGVGWTIQVGSTTGSPVTSASLITHPYGGGQTSPFIRNTIAQPVAVPVAGALDLQISILYSAGTAGNWQYLQALTVQELN